MGGTAWALDRYLIEHADVTSASDYQGLPGTQNSGSATTGATSAGDGVIDGTTYTSSDRQITITSYSSGSGNSAMAWFVADVRLNDVTAVRNAFAKNTFGTNIIEYPTAIAQSAGALFAINGDYYGFRDTGIIIRDGVAFRDEPARQGLAIMRDGSMISYDETATNAAKLISDGAWQTLCGAGRTGGLQPRRRWLFPDGLQRIPRQQPARQEQGTWHQRHPVDWKVTPCSSSFPPMSPETHSSRSSVSCGPSHPFPTCWS